LPIPYNTANAETLSANEIGKPTPFTGAIQTERVVQDGTSPALPDAHSFQVLKEGKCSTDLSLELLFAKEMLWLRELVNNVRLI
jgi:hypothetical protein